MSKPRAEPLERASRPGRGGLWRDYWTTASAAATGRTLSREQVLELQRRRLRRLIAHAYRNVPYYRRLFDRHGIDPREIREAGDLQRLPVTTKDDLRSAPLSDLLARGTAPDRLIATNTSGSEGAPFTTRRTPLEQQVSELFWQRAERSFGLRAGDRRALVFPILAHHTRRQGLARRALWGLGLWRCLRLECRGDDRDLMRAVLRWRPDYLAGFPNVLARLGELNEEAGERAVRPRIVRASGEMLTEEVRARIARAFGARVYNLYASQEMNPIAWECKRTGALHVCDDGVIIELLRDGRPVARGEGGEVVGTNLHYLAMPFIRYRLGDIAVRGDAVCRCGRPFSTIRAVVGRTSDYLVLPGGRLFSPYLITGLIRECMPWVRRYQIRQEALDTVVVRVIPAGQVVREDVGRLERAAREALGAGVSFRVLPVRDIPREASGKFLMCYSAVGRAASGTT